MGFVDELGYPLINEEQKVRIALSEKARIVMAEDMSIFGVSKPATFINTVIRNFKYEAKSSISLFLKEREIELERILSEACLDSKNHAEVIAKLLAAEEHRLIEETKGFCSSKGESKLYHINDENLDYLIDDCEENIYFNRPGFYIRSLIEEYCSLPFIQRERIYRKEVYDTIERACRDKKVLKIKATPFGKDQIFFVYPYKIVPDSYHSQSYLVCYSRSADKSEEEKKVVSFTMARVNHPTVLSKRFHLNKQEIENIEFQIAKYSPAYIINKPEQIKVKLTEKGKRMYQNRIVSRPEKIDSLSTDDIYVFDCTHHQIFNYFFPFGAEAEIISPAKLRDRFSMAFDAGAKLYNG